MKRYRRPELEKPSSSESEDNEPLYVPLKERRKEQFSRLKDSPSHIRVQTPDIANSPDSEKPERSDSPDFEPQKPKTDETRSLFDEHSKARLDSQRKGSNFFNATLKKCVQHVNLTVFLQNDFF